jgi:putative ATP-dependent endonuclease of OLD family
MKIKNIEIKNYRLLKDFKIDLEDNLSLVIGKNNCGKTSFLSILERFLVKEENSFSFDDFNIEYQQELKTLIKEADTPKDFYFGLSMTLEIHYDESDDLTNISSLMLNLEPDTNVVVLGFHYAMEYESFIRLKKDFKLFIIATKKDDITYFLMKNHKGYFKLEKKAVDFDNPNNTEIVSDKNLIKKIINFQRIGAKRNVRNEGGETNKSDRTLSKMSSKYYEKISNSEDEEDNTKELKKKLSETDESLNIVYEKVFKKIVDKVDRFGGFNKGDSLIEVKSTLEEKNILKENTSIMYRHNGKQLLPEDYNGLGYMNLIAMIFEIEVILHDFKKEKQNNIIQEIPADINLLFIEEPEAHTHPQMQYIFIKNIKELLKEGTLTKGGANINLQTVISTHSSHIVAESDFNDIKYLFKQNPYEVKIRSLKELEKEYEENGEVESFNFLKKYLTLNRAELFFSEKAVFIEGDTERLLLPAMMKKLDYDNEDVNKTNGIVPLLSQNISVIEIGGAYYNIFEKFIDFLGIKGLIITDIDSCKLVKVLKDGKFQQTKDGKDKLQLQKCPVVDGTSTKNPTLNLFYDKPSISDLLIKKIENKTFKKTKPSKKWAENKEGNLLVIYQIKENNYNARSFEDAFINLNLGFIKSNKDKFTSIRNKKELDGNDFYLMADKCLKGKTLFALDILYYSDEKFENWFIPEYIKEGLLWLQN